MAITITFISVKSRTSPIDSNHLSRRGKQWQHLQKQNHYQSSKSCSYAFNHKSILFQSGLSKINLPSAIHDLSSGVWDPFKYGTHRRSHETFLFRNKQGSGQLLCLKNYPVCSFFPVFLMPAKVVFVSRMCFLGFSKYSIGISSPQVMPLLLLASTWENPGACPVFHPNIPWQCGPVLCFPPFPTIWHWAHFYTKLFLSFSTSPISKLFFHRTQNEGARLQAGHPTVS